MATIAFGAFITGSFNNFTVGSNNIDATNTVYGYGNSTFDSFALIMVWLYIIGWSTYGPEAPATFAPEFVDTKNDTRLAIATTGGLNVVLVAAAADRRGRHRRHQRSSPATCPASSTWWTC